MNREQKYRITKIASILSLVIVLSSYGVYLYFEYQKYNNSFEDLKEVKSLINEIHVVQITDSEQPTETGDPKYSQQVARFFKDSSNVAIYFWTLAIMDEQELFYEQFDPNLRITDFPDAASMSTKQSDCFNQLTRGGTLTDIRLLDNISNRVSMELIYSDGVRKETRIEMETVKDAHGSLNSWVVITSIHDLIRQVSLSSSL
ncbi:hypothetical protein BLGI_4686 [Brevibacillus laterosporus GI-9]|uniref:hypothetical protein n=1 Tax=Brevibacillus TaxID=55080 RepID=UPI000240546C|nr:MULTISPECIES: hypothetical protein [Brevibacillus]MCR8964180.1 hypothetical protein [Brevibacillus laterosporus]MCZ0836335.1 hypothetical protein [Brevibacillus halotolerans]CCF16717.1 hypothetical protein BLGI_4686 [Brevibacillus laterosporus GI-9]